MKKTKIAMTLMIVLVVACTLLFAACQVKLESISITGAAEVQVGSSITLTATKDPSTYEGTIVWSSASDATATVTQSGVVTGVAAGTVKIKATLDGIVGEHSVTVTAVPVVDPLPAYKTSKIAELDTYFATFVKANYSAANQTALDTALATGKTNINAATTTALVDTALTNAKTALAKVLTIAETNSVDEFKKDHAAVLKLIVEEPTSAQTSAGINQVASVDKIPVQLALAGYDKLSSKVQSELSAEKTLLDSLLVKINEIVLVTYKSDEISAITNLAKTYTSSIYYTEDVLNIQGWFTQAKLDIDDAESQAAVDAIVTAVKAQANAVLKISEVLAIDSFPSTYEDVLSLTANTITLDDKQELEIAIVAFGNLSSNVQSSLSSVKSILNSLSVQIDVLELANKKIALVIELEAYVDGLKRADYSTTNWSAITNFISTAKSGVNSATTTVAAYGIVIKAVADCEAVLNLVEQGFVADFNTRYTNILSLTVDTVASTDAGKIGLARDEIAAWAIAVDVAAVQGGLGAYSPSDIAAYLAATDSKLKSLQTQITVLVRAELVTAANKALDNHVASLTRANYGTETWQDILDIVDAAKVEIAKQAAKPQSGTTGTAGIDYISNSALSTLINKIEAGGIIFDAKAKIVLVATRTVEAGWVTTHSAIITTLGTAITVTPAFTKTSSDALYIGKYQAFVDSYYALSTESKANVASIIGAGAIASGNGANLGEAVAKIAGWVGTFESTVGNYHADLTTAVGVAVTYPTSGANQDANDVIVGENLGKVQDGIDYIETLTADGQTKLATVLESLEKKLVDIVANQLAAHKTAAKTALDDLVKSGAANDTVTTGTNALYSTSNVAKVNALVAEYKTKIDAAASIDKLSSADTKTNGVKEILAAGKTAIGAVILEASKVAYNTFLLQQADVLALTTTSVKISNLTKVSAAITAYETIGTNDTRANIQANLSSELAHLNLLKLTIIRAQIQEVVDSYNAILAGKVSELYIVDYYAAEWAQIVEFVNGELSRISTALGLIDFTKVVDAIGRATTVLNNATGRKAGALTSCAGVETIFAIITDYVTNPRSFAAIYEDILNLVPACTQSGSGQAHENPTNCDCNIVTIDDKEDVEEAIAVFKSLSLQAREELATEGNHLQALLTAIKAIEFNNYQDAAALALQNIILESAVEVRYYEVDYSSANWDKIEAIIDVATVGTAKGSIYHADVKTTDVVDTIIISAKADIAAIKTIVQEVAAFKAVIGTTLAGAIPELKDNNIDTYRAIVNAWDALSTDDVRVEASKAITGISLIEGYNASSKTLLTVMGGDTDGSNKDPLAGLIKTVNDFEKRATTSTDKTMFLEVYKDLFDGSVTHTVATKDADTYVGNHVELVETARAAFDKLSKVTQDTLEYDTALTVKSFIESCEKEIARINLAAYITEQVNKLNIIRDGLGTKYSDTNKGIITVWINDATNTSDGTIYVLNPWATNYDGAAGGPLTKAIVDAAVKVITDDIDGTLTRAEERVVASYEAYYEDVIDYLVLVNVQGEFIGDEDDIALVNYKSDIRAALAEFKTLSDKIQTHLEANGISEDAFNVLLDGIKVYEKAQRSANSFYNSYKALLKDYVDGNYDGSDTGLVAALVALVEAYEDISDDNVLAFLETLAVDAGLVTGGVSDTLVDLIDTIAAETEVDAILNPII